MRQCTLERLSKAPPPSAPLHPSPSSPSPFSIFLSPSPSPSLALSFLFLFPLSLSPPPRTPRSLDVLGSQAASRQSAARAARELRQVLPCLPARVAYPMQRLLSVQLALPGVPEPDLLPNDGCAKTGSSSSNDAAQGPGAGAEALLPAAGASSCASSCA